MRSVSLLSTIVVFLLFLFIILHHPSDSSVDSFAASCFNRIIIFLYDRIELFTEFTKPFCFHDCKTIESKMALLILKFCKLCDSVIQKNTKNTKNTKKIIRLKQLAAKLATEDSDGL